MGSDWSNLLKSFMSDANWWDDRLSLIFLLQDLPENLEHWLQNAFSFQIHPSAQIDSAAQIQGHVVIDEGVELHAGAIVHGPVYIGARSKVGPNCYLHDGVFLGSDSRVGQGAEITHSMILDSARIHHFSYIGRSLVGRNVNIAAGVITAVRRFDNKSVHFRIGDSEVSPSFKGGAIIGDNAQLGVNVTVLPGRSIAPYAEILPATNVKLSVEEAGERYPNDSDMDSDKLPDPYAEVDIWSASLWMWDREADRFWTRSNVFLAVNGAMIVISTSSLPGTPSLGLMIALFGLIFSFFWARVNIMGKYYLDRWKPSITKLEDNWPVRPVTEIQLLAREHPIPSRFQSSTKYMLYVIRLIRAFWFAAFLWSLYQLIAPSLPLSLDWLRLPDWLTVLL